MRTKTYKEIDKQSHRIYMHYMLNEKCNKDIRLSRTVIAIDAKNKYYKNIVKHLHHDIKSPYQMSEEKANAKVERKVYAGY